LIGSPIFLIFPFRVLSKRSYNLDTLKALRLAITTIKFSLSCISVKAHLRLSRKGRRQPFWSYLDYNQPELSEQAKHMVDLEVCFERKLLFLARLRLEQTKNHQPKKSPKEIWENHSLLEYH
jgi:hypothetical protein